MELTRYMILGFVRYLSLFIFFEFGLLFLRNERSEWSPSENFWVCSNFGFVRSLVLLVFFGFGLFFFCCYLLFFIIFVTAVGYFVMCYFDVYLLGLS